MARQRITTIYPRDVRALSALGKCGHVTEEQLHDLGLRDKRIKSYCKDGLVEKVLFSRAGSRSGDITCYKLTRAGRDFCETRLSMSKLYIAQSAHHDLRIAERYFSLSDTEQATWRTESQCRADFENRIQELRDQGAEEQARALWERFEEGRVSMPDAVYVTDGGVTLAFEVVTNNYGQAELEAKEEAAEALGADIEYSKV